MGNVENRLRLLHMKKRNKVFRFGKALRKDIVSDNGKQGLF